MNEKITAAIVAMCDTCPWNAKTENMLEAVWRDPKWVERCQAAWREVMAMDADTIQANVDYVNERLDTNVPVAFLLETYVR